MQPMQMSPYGPMMFAANHSMPNVPNMMQQQQLQQQQIQQQQLQQQQMQQQQMQQQQMQQQQMQHQQMQQQQMQQPQQMQPMMAPGYPMPMPMSVPGMPMMQYPQPNVAIPAMISANNAQNSAAGGTTRPQSPTGSVCSVSSQMSVPAQPMMVPMGYFPQMVPPPGDGVSSPQPPLYPQMFFGWPGQPMFPAMAAMAPGPPSVAGSYCGGDNADYQHIQVGQLRPPDVVVSKDEACKSEAEADSGTQQQPDVVPDEEPTYINQHERAVSEQPQGSAPLTQHHLNLPQQPTYSNDDQEGGAYMNELPPPRCPRGMSMPPQFEELIPQSPMVPPRNSRRGSSNTLNKSTHSLHALGMALSEGIEAKIRQFKETVKSQHPVHKSKGNPRRPPRKKDKKRQAAFATLPRNFKSSDLTSINEDGAPSPNSDEGKLIIPMPGTSGAYDETGSAKSPLVPVVAMPTGSPESSQTLSISPAVAMPGTAFSDTSTLPSNSPNPVVAMPGTFQDQQQHQPAVSLPGGGEQLPNQVPAVPMPGVSSTINNTGSFTRGNSAIPSVPQPGSLSALDPKRFSIISSQSFQSEDSEDLALPQVPIIMTSPTGDKSAATVPPVSQFSGVVVMQDETVKPRKKIKHEYEEIDFKTGDDESDQKKKSKMSEEDEDEEFEPVETPPGEKVKKSNDENKKNHDYDDVIEGSPGPFLASTSDKDHEQKKKNHEYDDVEFVHPVVVQQEEKDPPEKQQEVLEPVDAGDVETTVAETGKAVEDRSASSRSSSRANNKKATKAMKAKQEVDIQVETLALKIPRPQQQKNKSKSPSKEKTPGSEKDNSIMETSNQILAGLREMDNKIQNLKIGMVKVYEDVYARHVYAAPNKTNKSKSMSELAHLGRADLKDDYEDVEMVTKAVMEIKTTYVPRDEEEEEEAEEAAKVVVLDVDESPRYENSEVLAEMWREAQEARLEKESYENQEVINEAHKKEDEVASGQDSYENQEVINEQQKEAVEVGHDSYENQEVIEVHEELAKVGAEQKEGEEAESQANEEASEDEEQPEPVIDIEAARKEIGKQFRQNFFGLHQQDTEEEQEEEGEQDDEPSKVDDTASEDPGTETLDVTLELPDTSTAPLPDPGLFGKEDEAVKDDETIADFLDDPRDEGEVEEEEQESYDWNEMEDDLDASLVSTVLQEKLRSGKINVEKIP